MRLAGLLSLWICVFAGSAAAATHTLGASKDTFVDQAAQTTDHSGLAYISLSANTGALKRGLMEFTLPSVPSTEYVSSAVLRLWVVDAAVSTVDVRRLLAPWASATVNWTNQPAFDTAVLSSTFYPGTAGAYVEVDVTSLVRTWVEGSAPNYGLIMIVRSGTSLTQFATVNATDPAQHPQLTITTQLRPNLALAVSTQVNSDPFNAAVNPKRIPGALIQHSVVVTNSAGGTPTSGSVVVVESVPPQTTLFVGDLGAVGSGPVALINGSPSSGLTYTFSGLASTSDDLSFSNDGGASFNYTPSPDASGYDSAVDAVRVNPKGVFAANTGSGSPSFTLRMRLRND